jgi:drug/metabolite transporter (DMT)-like permease
LNVLNERLTLKAGCLALLTAVLWGGNSVAIKVGLSGFPPIALAAARFFFGGLAVLTWAILSKIPIRLQIGERRALLFLVVLFIVQIYTLNAGTHLTLAGRSTVFISIYPFFTAFFAHIFIPGDRLSRLKVIGMILSFVGVVTIFAESLAVGRFEYLPGDILVFISGLLLGARQVYTKRLTQNIDPARILLWQAAMSLPIFIVASLLLEDQSSYQYSTAVAGAILYQGLVIAGFCFMVITALLRRHRASRLGVFGFVTPVIGVVLSNVLLGEGISTGLLVSMFLVGIGIAIVNYES